MRDGREMRKENGKVKYGKGRKCNRRNQNTQTGQLFRHFWREKNCKNKRESEPNRTEQKKKIQFRIER